MPPTPHEPTVLYERAAGVARIVLHRPHRRNAWTGRMEMEYRRAMARAEVDDDVVVIVITGAGDAFCVGADAAALDGISRSGTYDSGVTGSDPLPGRGGDLAGPHSFITGLTKPVIAAVNGPAAGVGFVLMCFADLRYVAADAKLTTSTARLGLPAEYGLSWQLPRLVGLTAAADLLLTSRVILGEEAVRIGLANGCFPAGDVLSATCEVAERMARECAPSSLQTIKAQLYDDQRRTLQAAERAYFDHLHAMVGSTDFREGVSALMERRAPDFRAAAGDRDEKG